MTEQYRTREKPRTVTRNLSHYVIGRDYQRLLRLAREHDHMYDWHSYEARALIRQQCARLHYRVYREHCYYA